ncbi:MAG: 30S ribosomal protein S3 [Solobacterium sp.]|nr:30S ribosomal protein S3 [Solobacterium sp.]
MGQKVSPIGMRVGVIRDWESRWYAEKADFGDLLNEDIKIRKYIEKNLHDAYVSRVEIERTGKTDVKVLIRCARPGAAAGKDDKGADKMDALRKQLSKLTDGKNVKVDIIAVANPDLDAHLVARKICEQLEARQSFRIAQKKAIQQTMRSGAKGIKTLASGRLGGAEIARKEGYSQGVVPLHTLRSDIDYANDEAHTTYGKIGVKVWICRGEVLPGKMVEEPKAPEGRFNRDRRNGRGGRNDRRGNRGDRRNAAAPAAKPAAPAEAAAPQEGGN